MLRTLTLTLLIAPTIVLGQDAPATLASPPETPALSLAEARRLAAERSWTLLAAGSAVRQAEGLHQQSHAWPNPTALFSVGKLNLTTPGDNGSTSDTTAGVSQLVELGGKRANRIRAATAALSASRGQLQAARVGLDAGVVKAYAAALAAREAARIGEDSRASLKRAAAIAEVRFQAGEISAAERDQTRVAAGRFAADTRAAEAAARQALITLQTLLGEPVPGGGLRLTDDFDVLSRLVVASPAAQPEGDAAALDARGDVLAARAAVEQAEAQLALQKAVRVPDLTLSAQYESDRPDNPHTFGAGVSLPLPLFDRNHGGIATATAALEQAQREVRRVRAQDGADLAAARSALAAAIDRRRLLRDELLPRAESVRKTVAFSYEKGLASLLELLEAERSLNEVRLAAVATEGEAVSAAADVATALGETLP